MLNSINKDPAIGFSANQTEDGYTPSLTSIFGHFLTILQERYGPRDVSYTPLGIEFSGEIPMVWYPGNCKHVSIILTERAKQSLPHALFELAHEAVHIIAPSGGRNANILEEGLAALFQIEISKLWHLGLNIELESYLVAAAQTKSLMDKEENVIRKLRKIIPEMYNWTPDFIRQNVDAELGDLPDTLCQRFNRNL